MKNRNTTKNCTAIRSSILWDVMQRRWVVSEVSEQPTGSVFKGHPLGLLDLEDGNDRLYRNVGNDKYIHI
jgi:transcription elongation GreA/GreB family factor